MEGQRAQRDRAPDLPARGQAGLGPAASASRLRREPWRPSSSRSTCRAASRAARRLTLRATLRYGNVVATRQRVFRARALEVRSAPVRGRPPAPRPAASSASAGNLTSSSSGPSGQTGPCRAAYSRRGRKEKSTRIPDLPRCGGPALRIARLQSDSPEVFPRDQNSSSGPAASASCRPRRAGPAAGRTGDRRGERPEPRRSRGRCSGFLPNQLTSFTFIGTNDMLVLEKGTRPRPARRGWRPCRNRARPRRQLHSERGLLGIALHRFIFTTGRLFLYWTESRTGADSTAWRDVPLLGNRVDRFVWNGSTLTFEARTSSSSARIQDDAGQPLRGQPQRRRDRVRARRQALHHHRRQRPARPAAEPRRAGRLRRARPTCPTTSSAARSRTTRT